MRAGKTRRSAAGGIHRSMRCEGLEDRRLMAFNAFAELDTGRVAFVGDAADDTLIVSIGESGRLIHNRGDDPGFEGRLDLDNSQPGVQSLLAEDIAAIAVDAGDGLDRLRIVGNFEVGASVEGGADLRLSSEATAIDRVHTNGGDFVSEGDAFFARGALIAGEVNLNRQSGPVGFARGVLSETFTAIDVASFRADRGVRATQGDVRISSQSGIGVSGIVAATNDGAGEIGLRATGRIDLAAVGTDGGGFAASSEVLAIRGQVRTQGGDIRLTQTRGIGLGGDVSGGAIGMTGASIQTRPGVDILARQGGVRLQASEGPIVVMGAVRAANDGEGAIAVETPGSAMIGAMAADGGSIGVRSARLQVGGAIATRGGEVALLQAGATVVGRGVLTGGGAFHSTGGALAVGGDVATAGGEARMDHASIVVRGRFSTRGEGVAGAIHARLRVSPEAEGPRWVVGEGDLLIPEGSTLLIDVSSIVVESGDRIPLIHTRSGQIRDLGLETRSTPDANGDPTDFEIVLADDQSVLVAVAR